MTSRYYGTLCDLVATGRLDDLLETRILVETPTKTLKAIGKAWGVSATRVSQIEARIRRSHLCRRDPLLTGPTCREDLGYRTTFVQRPARAELIRKLAAVYYSAGRLIDLIRLEDRERETPDELRAV
jgi:hypothetical protein